METPIVTFRQCQSERIPIGLDILQRLNIVYLVMEPRTGKTLTSMMIAYLYGAKNVLFLTTAQAKEGIQDNYDTLYKWAMPGTEFTIINDESAHKVDGDFDLLIRDEHDRSGAYEGSAPGLYTTNIRKRWATLPMIFLSGTPCPEGHAQWYHQFWVSNHSPFKLWPRFSGRCGKNGAWHRTFIEPALKDVGHGLVNDYSGVRIELVAPIIEPYLVRCTQEEAGFKCKPKEHFIDLEIPKVTKFTLSVLKKDRVVKGEKYCITADTSAKLSQKMHQLAGESMIFDPEFTGQKDCDRPRKVLGTTKADYIKSRWGGKQIVIFYCFKEELTAIKQVMGDAVTNDLEEFHSSNKSIALQIKSGCAGLDLSKAELLVFYNVSFSYRHYRQALDRLLTIDAEFVDVYWLMFKGGMEQKIYARVKNKEDYTTAAFKKDFGIKDNKRVQGSDRKAPPRWQQNYHKKA